MKTDGYVNISRVSGILQDFEAYVKYEGITTILGLYSHPQELEFFYTSAEVLPYIRLGYPEKWEKLTHETMGIVVYLPLPESFEGDGKNQLMKLAYNAIDSDLYGMILQIDCPRFPDPGKMGALPKAVELLEDVASRFPQINFIITPGALWHKVPKRKRKLVPQSVARHSNMWYLFTQTTQLDVVTQFEDDKSILLGSRYPYTSIGELEKVLLDVTQGDSVGNRPPIANRLNLDLVYENLLTAAAQRPK